MIQALEKKMLRSVNPAAIGAYFRAHGWRKYGIYRDVNDIYSFEGKQALAPSSADYSDYADIVHNAILVLAEVEGRPEWQILRDLQEADADVIRFRIPGAEENGSIPITKGRELIEQSYGLLMSAACAADRPQAVYRTGRNREASSYIEKVQLGQTEQGSFVFTLLSKVPPSSQFQPDLFDAETAEEEQPFSRKVTQNLVRGLNAVKGAIASVNRGGAYSAFEEQITSGVSANLCESLAHFAEHNADISLNWASTRPAVISAYNDRGQFRISFNAAEGEILKEASSILKSRVPRYDEVLTGMVVKLESENPEESGKATFKFVIDGKLSSVSAQCAPGLYQQLISAHREHNEVQLEGDLEPQNGGRGWVLTNPRRLEIITDS